MCIRDRGNIEINGASVNKGKAMEWLCGYLGIGREATLAIGDGDNDMQMIGFAAYGVAMGNSPEELKAVSYTHLRPQSLT